MNKMKWWNEAKFGMFIHWGPYAIPGGVWNNKAIEGVSEWIMKSQKIPCSQYEKISAEFNPTEFNAYDWVKLAKDVGMKYLTITAKHHDGFAMYHSKCSSYNIVDYSKFSRDPIAEIAKECHEQGVKLSFYYSHFLDWHHPHGYGNDWDYLEDKKDFSIYFYEKCLPQIKELLTSYGDVGQIWFDGGTYIEQKYANEIADTIHEIQPKCIISGRVGWGYGDFTSMSDNSIPVNNFDRPWDTPSTLNDNWGYSSVDTNFKEPKHLISLLTEINSKGGNYLLNIGPDEKGIIPAESKRILREVGKWVIKNSEAIYATQCAPILPYKNSWGHITCKLGTPLKLYLHVLNPPKNNAITINFLENDIIKAYPLNDRENLLDILVMYFPAEPGWRRKIELPTQMDDLCTVICLELAGDKPIIEELK